MPKVDDFLLNILNKKTYRNEFHNMNFSLYIPDTWQFKVQNFLFKENDDLDSIIEFESKNQLSFGNLKIYKNSIKPDKYEEFFYNYVKSQIVFDKIDMVRKSGNNLVAKFIIEKKDKYDLFSKSIYLGMYFFENYIYQIFIFGSNDFNFELFDKQSIQILSSFSVSSDVNLEKGKFIFQGIEISFQKDWKILNTKENQLLTFQYLKKPLFLDFYYLGEINGDQSFDKIRNDDQIKLFADLTSISSTYNYIYNKILPQKLNLNFLASNQWIYSLYIFGLSSSISSVILEDQFKVYYIQFENHAYKIHLWYNLLEYKQNYDDELAKIMQNFKFQ